MKFISLVILFIVCVSNVYAFGLASSYLEDKTMILSPGESRNYVVELQNNDKNIIKLKFVIESNITEIINEKDFYSVGGDKIKQNILLNVTMPEDATEKDKYVVKYYTYQDPEQEGQVGLNFKIGDEFKVVTKIVEEKSKKTNIKKTFFAVMFVIILGFIFMMLYKSNIKLIKKFKR